MMVRALLLGMLTLSMPAAAFNLNDLKSKVEELKQSTSPAPSPQPSGLDTYSPQQQIESLKQALTQGAESAVQDLARADGYLGNPKVRIQMPENLRKVDSALRKVGLGRYADDFVTSMNRAAEAAVPEAKALLIAAVKNMTVNDAKDILLGNDDAATQYFRRSTESALSARFKPVVARSMDKVQLAQAYNRFAGKGVKLGLVKEKDAHLDDYITRKALDGLFLMIAEQEKAIRKDPLQATGDLARKIFSTLRGQ
ncbi:MAG: DUF4197 domain-containing protein [Sideroxydans sp.]|nr:DUF4197 domain-containing protein [Sideroxydans sp.]